MIIKKVKKLFDAIGNLFVYRYSGPMSGERLRRFQLMGLSNRLLREMIPTTSHYSKVNLVAMILEKEKAVR